MVRLHNPLVILAVVAEVAVEDSELVVVALNESHMIKTTENFDAVIPNCWIRKKLILGNIFTKTFSLEDEIETIFHKAIVKANLFHLLFECPTATFGPLSRERSR